MRRPLPAVALAAAALLPTATASAFSTFNQSALSRSFALPSLGDSAVLGDGATLSRTTLDLTNEYLVLAQGNEDLIEDGETTRLALQYRRGFGGGLDFGVEVPVLHAGGGFLDSFIENWHGWFGLPNGGREFSARDQYRYRYRRDGATVFDLTDSGTSLGDVLLLGGWQWRDGVALRGEVKLPTGDGDRLEGGNSGAALWADAALPFARGSTLSGFVSGGVSANARADRLGDQQRRVIPFGGIGIDWRAFSAVSLGAQIDAHAPLYRDSELDAFTRPGVQLVFGGAYHGAGGARFDLAIQEDIVTRSSPDFSIHLALTLVPRYPQSR